MKLREYETIYVLRPDLGEDGITQITERVRGVLASREAVVLRDDAWGKRRLAYEVQKHLKGIYYYLHYLAVPGTVEEVERTFKMVEPVIKFQSVKLADDVNADARIAEIEKEKAEEEQRRKEREEREAAERARRAAAMEGDDDDDDFDGDSGDDDFDDSGDSDDDADDTDEGDEEDSDDNSDDEDETKAAEED